MDSRRLPIEERKRIAEEQANILSSLWKTKKHNRVKVQGRGVMTIRQYIRLVASKMANLNWQDNGQRIDHVQMLKAYYLESGLDGINKYIEIVDDMVSDAIKEQSEKNGEVSEKTDN